MPNEINYEAELSIFSPQLIIGQCNCNVWVVTWQGFYFWLNCFLLAALAPIDTICLLSSKDTTAQKECKHLLSEYTHYFHISNNCRQLSLLLLLFTQTVFVSMIWWLPLKEKVVCENCRRAIPDIKGVSTLPQKGYSTLPGHFCKTNLPRFLMDLSDEVGWSILGWFSTW